jgi:hypothetical protein
MNGKDEKSWRELCKAASCEMDSEKLMALVSELTLALDRQLGKAGNSSPNCRKAE